MDLFGPAGTKAVDGETYGCVVVDTEAENIHVEGLQRKEANQTLEALKLYMQEHPGNIAEIRTDDGSEWKGAFEKFCLENQIRQTKACPYSQYQNQSSERAVGTIKRGGRRNLMESGLPDELWLHACKTAATQHNQSVTANDKTTTPLWRRFGMSRRPRKLIVFGAPAYTLILPKEARPGVLGTPAFVGYFVGYDKTSNGFVIYNKTTRTTSVRRDVSFDEHWRYRSNPTADQLTPITFDGSSPVPGPYDGKPLEPVDDEGGPQPKVSSMVQNVPDEDGHKNAPDHEPLSSATPTPTPTPQAPTQSTPLSQDTTPMSDRPTGTTSASDQSGAAAATDQTPSKASASSTTSKSSGSTSRTPKHKKHEFISPTTKNLHYTQPTKSVLRVTAKGRYSKNKSVHRRVTGIDGKTFDMAKAQKFTYTDNQNRVQKYKGSDLDWDLNHGYLTIQGDACHAKCEACAKRLAAPPRTNFAVHLVDDAFVLRVTDTVDEGADEDEAAEDDDAFDEERVPDHLADFARQFEHSKAASGKKNRQHESHLDLCCGPKLSKSHAALSADSTCRVLALDVLKEKEIEEETNTWPLDFQRRFTYIKFDLRDLTYRRFQNVVRDYLGIKVTSLSTVHVSSPCTTYTKAHHGKNPHRYKLVPLQGEDGELARQHDRLLNAVFDVLRQFSNHAYRTVITAENPVCDFQHMPIIRRLLCAPGWFKRTADHCMHRREHEQIFPRKRSTWLLFNVCTDVPTRKCDGTCGCVIEGTSWHRLLVCYRSDKHKDQHVMKCPKEMGRIPAGIFDMFSEYRLQARDSTGNPNKPVPVPIDPVNEILVDTKKARDTDIAARCEMADGHTFNELVGQKYTTKLGTQRTYTVAHLRQDLQKGYLRLKVFARDNVFTVEEFKQLKMTAREEVSDLIESIFHIHAGDDPTSEKEALQGPDAEAWRESMALEIDQLIALGCWTYELKSKKPAGAKVYRGKMVLKTKPAANGQPRRRKSRYVISDPKFLQKLGDYDCFSPMCRLVRWLLSTSVERDWNLISTDIKNAFPTARLPEPVWMEVPKAVLDRHRPDGPDPKPELQDCYALVSMALYGLGHSPAAFHKHLDDFFQNDGWEPLEADSCVYIKYGADGKVSAIAATFVDDAVVTGTDEALAEYRKFMQSGFTISDVGTPEDFLGMQISYDRKNKKIKLWQEKYIKKMAERYNITLSAKPPRTPMDYNKKLEPTQDGDELFDPTLYRSYVGAIQYAVCGCRIDCCFTVRELAKHMVKPNVNHAAAARHCIQYLLATAHIGITYEHGDYQRHYEKPKAGFIVRNGVIEMYTDASFAEDVITRKSVSGYASVKNKAVITYGVKGQTKVALSSGDAELRALSECKREADWLHKLRREANDDRTVRSNLTKLPAMTIWEDNKSTITWVSNPCQHNKVKHIDVPLKNIRNAFGKLGELDIEYIGTTAQLADCLTKALAPTTHWKLIQLLMNIPCSDLPTSVKMAAAT